MAKEKNIKIKPSSSDDDNHDAVSSYVTAHDVIQLCAFWSKNNAGFGEVVQVDNLERDVKIVKKSEIAILEITLVNKLREEKVIRIEIKIYE